MQIITPKNEQEWLELRTLDITSTEIGALFGISPYMTAFELWHRKKEGNVIKIDDNERMAWGRRLQKTIAEEIAKEQQWTIREMTEYIRNEELKIGSSFDFSIETTESMSLKETERVVNQGIDNYTGLLEIKNVDGLVFHNDWTETEAPLHIEIQVQHQLLVSGRAFAYIGALVGGNRLVLIKREPDLAVHEAIKDKVAAFWASIMTNTPPSPNMEVDANFIGKLYNYAEPNKVITLEDEDVKTMALRYREAGEKIKELDKIREVIKADLLMRLGDAEKAIGDGFSISAGMVGPTHVSYDREGYRNFRINFKKEK